LKLLTADQRLQGKVIKIKIKPIMTRSVST
jgi:hypothetical protein